MRDICLQNIVPDAEGYGADRNVGQDFVYEALVEVRLVKSAVDIERGNFKYRIAYETIQSLVL